MKNSNIISIVSIALSIIVIGLIIGGKMKDADNQKNLRFVAKSAYERGFARSANMLYDEKGCTLATTPNLDSLFRVDVKINGE